MEMVGAGFYSAAPRTLSCTCHQDQRVQGTALNSAQKEVTLLTLRFLFLWSHITLLNLSRTVRVLLLYFFMLENWCKFTCKLGAALKLLAICHLQPSVLPLRRSFLMRKPSVIPQRWRRIPRHELHGDGTAYSAGHSPQCSTRSKEGTILLAGFGWLVGFFSRLPSNGRNWIDRIKAIGVFKLKFSCLVYVQVLVPWIKKSTI